MGFKTKYDNSKNNLSGLNEQKASFRKSFLGILGAFLNVILPILILLGVTIYFIFTILDSADYYPYEENLSYMYALSTLSTLGAFGGIFYLIFYNGLDSICFSLKSSTTIISYSGGTYAVDASGNSVSIRQSHGSGLALLILAIQMFTNYAVIVLTFIRNLLVFIICLFIPAKRIEIIENGYDFYDMIKETNKVFVVFFSIEIAISLISLVLFICSL